MKIKARTSFDLNSNQFKYLEEKEIKVIHRVDINELNKRLNENKKSNFYTTTLVAILCLSCLAIISFIGLKF